MLLCSGVRVRITEMSAAECTFYIKCASSSLLVKSHSSSSLSSPFCCCVKSMLKDGVAFYCSGEEIWQLTHDN